MNDHDKLILALDDIPAGKAIVTVHGGGISSEILSVKTDGRASIDIFPVFPGVELSLHRYAAENVIISHRLPDNVLEINHCRRGRIGWSMGDNIKLYLGAGDMCLHSADCCAHSSISLPLGYYEGIKIFADIGVLKKNCPPLLYDAGISLEDIRSKFCQVAKTAVIPANSETENLFSVLYELEEPLRTPYNKLKVQEIFLCLSRLEPPAKRDTAPYFSQKAETIKQIRDFLTENLDRRFTIEELSRKYLLNTSALKEAFKAVYGLPIGAYMKEYRIRRAMEMLRTTDDSIATIAERVGYETQGKFTKAFKEIAELPPSKYRKLCRR